MSRAQTPRSSRSSLTLSEQPSLADIDLSAKALGLRHLAAKNARIKAEQDRQLLANRIKRLHVEQEKAAKRIGETQKRTAQIKELREQNMQHVQAQQEAHLYLHMERELQRQAFNRVRTEREQGVASARASVWELRMRESDGCKRTRAAADAALRLQREATEREAAAKREAVRKAEADAQLRRLKEREDHLRELAAREEAKRAELRQRRDKHAELIAAMEGEELRLLKSLTECQDDQRDAFVQLELLIRESIPSPGAKAAGGGGAARGFAAGGAGGADGARSSSTVSTVGTPYGGAPPRRPSSARRAASRGP